MEMSVGKERSENDLRHKQLAQAPKFFRGFAMDGCLSLPFWYGWLDQLNPVMLRFPEASHSPGSWGFFLEDSSE